MLLPYRKESPIKFQRPKRLGDLDRKMAFGMDLMDGRVEEIVIERSDVINKGREPGN